MLHTLKKSTQIETQYSHLHDRVYRAAFDKIANDGFAINKIDREICNYDTKYGKKLQKSDVDTLLFFSGKEKTGCKKISEKVRNSAYDDLYLEVISVLMLNNDEYQVESLGWANKKICSPENDNSPDYLSYICLDHNKNSFKSLFITGYKKLKKELFFNENAILSNIVNPQFIQLVQNNIKQKTGKSSFSIKAHKKIYDNIIVAKNKSEHTGDIYYTIGITINIEKVRQLGVTIYQRKGQIKQILKNKI